VPSQDHTARQVISRTIEYMAGGHRFTCYSLHVTSPCGTDRHQGLELADGVHILTRKFLRLPGMRDGLAPLIDGSITFKDTVPRGRPIRDPVRA
jgi:hypothetical protein